MFCADRAVVSTLGQALRLAAEHPPEQVGVVVDTLPRVVGPGPRRRSLGRAPGGSPRYQVADWVCRCAPDALLSRGAMGDGCIDLAG